MFVHSCLLTDTRPYCRVSARNHELGLNSAGRLGLEFPPSPPALVSQFLYRLPGRTPVHRFRLAWLLCCRMLPPPRTYGCSPSSPKVDCRLTARCSAPVSSSSPSTPFSGLGVFACVRFGWHAVWFPHTLAGYSVVNDRIDGPVDRPYTTCLILSLTSVGLRVGHVALTSTCRPFLACICAARRFRLLWLV